MSDIVIEAKGLTKKYGARTVVDSIDLAVREQAVERESELICRAVSKGLKPLAANQLGSFEDAQDNVAVADINR